MPAPLMVVQMGLLLSLAGPGRSDPAAAGAAPLLEKGERLFRQGDTAGAIAAFEAAAKVDPKDARPHYLRGVALEKKGDLAAAAEAYRQAVARQAAFPEPHNNLGALLPA